MSDTKSAKIQAALFGKEGSRRDFLRNTGATALAGNAGCVRHLTALIVT